MVRMCGLDSCDTGQRLMVVLCEHGNESSGSIKSGNLLIS
jgi:hypothetical protein